MRILLNHKEEWKFSFANKWMELENIILSEVSQAHKAKNHMFFLPHMQILDLKQMQ
jgi:hypothetical protein